MARYLATGHAITGVSGSVNNSLGGSTFTKNGILRNRVVPLNPQTADQMEIRNAFAFLNSEWSEFLSDSERLAWETARLSGDFNQQDPLTGTSGPDSSAKALFIRLNINALIADLSLATPTTFFLLPPALAALGTAALTSLAIVASAGTVVLTYTGGLSGGETIGMKITQPLSPGNLKVPISKLRLLSPASSGASPQALGATYVAKFGPITAATGQAVFFQMWVYSTTDGRSRIVAAGRVLIVA